MAPRLSRLRRWLRWAGPRPSNLVEAPSSGCLRVRRTLDEASLAAHGLAINVTSTTYMIPLGVSSAAAVRVGHAVGRRDRPGIAASLGCIDAQRPVYECGGSRLVVAPVDYRALFCDASVLAIGARLLRIAPYISCSTASR